MNGNGISVNVEGIKSISNSLDGLTEELDIILNSIETSLNTINDNWSGEMKISAQSDIEIAQKSFEILRNIKNINGSFKVLKDNASKIGYRNNSSGGNEL